jgi:HAD superfamily hydrolase (TIGR01549 family)
MIDPRSITAVAFDCDGVMFDSSEANRAYYNRLLDHVGLPPMTPEQFGYAHMHTVDEAIEFLVPDKELRLAAIRYRQGMRYHDFIRHMVIEPFLIPLLDLLEGAYRTAVATNRTDTMDRVLETHGLEKRFDLVVTAMDVEHPKPHPEQLQVILRRFDCPPDRMVYIGDSVVDAEAATAAQVPFIAYGNTDLAADLHVDSLRQVAELLRRA